MPLDLGYASSGSDLSRPASPLRPTANSPETKRISIPLNGLDKREDCPAAEHEPRTHSNGSLDPKKNPFEAFSIKGSSRPRDEKGSTGGFKIAGVSSAKREEADLAVGKGTEAARNGSSQRSPVSNTDKEISRRPFEGRVRGSSPSEEGALESPRSIRRDGLDREYSPTRRRSGSGYDDASSSTKRDRRRSRGEFACTPERIDKDRTSPRRESKKRSRESDDEFESQTRPVKGSRPLARSPSPEIARKGTTSKTEGSRRDVAERSSDRPEQRTSHRLPGDDRERDYYRSSRSKRHDDGLDYETGGAVHGSDAYGRYAKDDRRTRPEYDDHRSRGRDRYDDRDYRHDRHRHDGYRDEERSSYRRGDHDGPYRAGIRRDHDDVRGDRYTEDDRSYRHRDMRDDRDRDYGRARGIDRTDERHARSPLVRPADEPRPRSPIAWTHAPQRGQIPKPPSPRRDLEPPAPPPTMPDLPPPPPSPPGLKRKPSPIEIAGEEEYRVNKRPKLSRQEPAIAIIPAPPPALPQEVPPPPLLEAGAVTPNPQLAEPQIDTRVSTPVPDQPVRNHDQDEIFRQERKQKRDLFPDRSRIGLGQGKRLDLIREAKIYGKAFAGLGRLEGYKVSKTGDGALGRGTFG